jgi:EAL domain-containing protein (putative c-di-GMP-specific phosphodiesterase class I)
VTQAVQTEAIELPRLRELGVSIAVDNFGGSCWSLRELASFPVDALKIDRSLVAAMLHDPHSLSVVSSILALAQALELRCVAEGVETQEQSKLLKIMRCDEQRGYLLSRPLPADACAELLSRHKDLRSTGRATRA